MKAALRRLRGWAARTVTPVAGRALLGWGIAKLIGGATARSRVAAGVTALTGAAAGLLGFALGPVGAPVLLGLLAGSVAATALWAAPTIRLLVALQDV